MSIEDIIFSLILSIFAQKTHFKSVDVVRKSIFRYLSVSFADGSMNIFIQKTFEDISIKSSS